MKRAATHSRHNTRKTRGDSHRSNVQTARRPTRNKASASQSRPKRTVTLPAASPSTPLQAGDAIPNASVPDLHDNRKRLIYEWLKPNIKQLLRAAADEQGIVYTNISSTNCCVPKPDCVRIVAAVCEDENVRRCFCFATVSNAVFEALRNTLRERVAQRRVCVEGGRNHKHCGHRTSMYFNAHAMPNRSHLPTRETGAFEGSVKPYIGNVRSSMVASSESESEYWRIITEASILDHGECAVREYTKRITKPFLKKNNKVQQRELAKALDSKATVGFAGQSESFYKGYNARKTRWVNIMHEVDNRLLAKWSISHEVATRLGSCPCTGKLYFCQISPSDKCHAFWRARFLFAGISSEGSFCGVALDTVLAVVWNADMTLKQHQHEVYRCGSSHWNCTLSRVTEMRWAQYVTPHNYSLSAFDDDSSLRFMPDEHIHLECQECYEALKERSVLLHPL
eukprot:TRINITY_DN2190_c0_g1_i1.p2 TRINITY_DN2190_c0_g1~~TRINITY_DN2190_c0_g1_i1.p2  ORF type:complete len:453 (-),score=59.40 TRINITY_DN2190_c0_g1_i1:1939-3297(-)